MKKFAALILALAMILSVAGIAMAEETGSVYYLNFKPEVADAWVELAKQFTAETGIEMTVVTAASGTYEDTLKSEIAKTNAPTLFQVNGPVGLNTWKDYCYDMAGSAFYGELTNDAFALKEGDAVLAIAYLTETYGLITNTALLEKAGYTVADITNFETLKAVAEDITARKDELGFAAFASAGMDSSSDWRFKTHLANMPLYYEYKADGITSTDAIKGTYLDGYKAIWDLYINNATCEPAMIAAKTGSDAEAEFQLEEAVFFQNGDWEYGAVSEYIADENLTMIPLYIGAEGEENQGLCTGTENFLCVNAKASEADIKATLDFLYWLVTSETGTTTLADTMGFDIPFKAAKESTNHFKKVAAEYVAAGKTPVTWNFTTMPSETWKNGVGAALTDYAAGNGEWDAVVTAFVDGWATEYAAANS
ncbi:MAG: ABC transporter substrate-binding protein [Clostridia bacterium]|nr:ABC transporter substrate-binding protein [Clostridia bacterium]